MVECQKDRFSLPGDVHYLNCAYMAPQSKRVTEAGLAALGTKERPYEILESHFFEGTARVRELFAQLVGVHEPDRVAVVPSSSYAFAQAVRNTPLSSGENVVTVEEEFPSLVYTLRRACADQGADCRFVARPQGGAKEWTRRIVEHIDARTAVVAISSVHWTDGTKFDLEAIGDRARDVGAAFMIDGTQSIGAAPFDFSGVQPDVLVCPAYKWLTGPYATGVAYFGPRYDDGTPIEESWMVREGSEDFAGLVNYTDQYRAGAVRYDVGETSNFVLVPMLIAALEQVLEWTPAGIQAYGQAITRDLLTTLPGHGFDVGDPEERFGHILGIRLPAGAEPRALRARLAERNIFVSVRGSALRVSVNVFNDAADIAALQEALVEG